MKRTAILLSLTAVCCLAACESTNSSSSSSSSAKPADAGFVDSGYYVQEMKNGRYYVFGTREGHQDFQQSGHMRLSKTFIGKGPGGATVVIELTDKDKQEIMSSRLVSEFNKRNGTMLK